MSVKCPVDRKGFDNLKKEVGGTRNAYYVYALYNERIPSLDELKKDGYLDDSWVKPKNFAVVVHLQRQSMDIAERIKKLDDNIRTLTNQSDKTVAMSKRQELVEERKSVGGMLRRARQDASFDRIETIGWIERRKVEKMLTNPNMTIDQLRQVVDICDMWIEASNVQAGKDHIIFTPEEVDVLTSTENKEGRAVLKAQIGLLRKLSSGYFLERGDGRTSELKGFADMKQIAMGLIHKCIKEQSAKYVGENADFNAMASDMSWIASQGLAVRHFDHPYVKAITGIMDRSNKLSAIGADRGRDDIWRVFGDYKSIKDAVGKLNVQTVSNTDKRRTGDGVDRFTHAWYRKVNRIRTALHEKQAIAKANVDNDTALRMEAEAYSDYFKDLQQVADIIDVRYLFTKEELQRVLPNYEHKITDEQALAYRDALTKKLGVRGYDEVMESVKTKWAKFIDEQKFEKDTTLLLIGDKYKTEEDAQKHMDWWNAQNNPIKIVEYAMDGLPIGKVGDRWVNSPNFSYIEYIAKDKNDYDNNYAQIEANDDYFKLWKFWRESTATYASMLPQDQTGMYQGNRIAKVPATVMQELFNSGLKGAASVFLNKFQGALLGADAKGVMSEVNKTVTGEDIKKVQVGVRLSLDTEVNEELSLMIDEYETKNGQAPTQDMIDNWRYDITDKLSEGYSTDMEASLLVLNMAYHSYKHKASVEPMVSALRKCIKELSAESANMSNVVNTGLKGAKMKKDGGLNHMQEAMEYTLDVWYGYPTKKQTPIGGKRYTAKDKNLKARYEAMIEANNKKLEEGKITKEEYAKANGQYIEKLDKLGSYVIAEKVAKKTMGYFHLLTFAYSPLSAISNLGQGFFDNFTEAAGGMYCTTKDMYFAVGRLLSAKSQPWSAESKKIANIMKRLAIIQSQRNELTVSGKSTLKKWQDMLDKWGPYMFTQNVEFFNQSSLVVAMLKHDGLWEKFNNEGEFEGDATIAEDFAMKADRLIATVHGDYKSPLLYDRDLWKQMVMMFKRWLGEAVYRRFGKEEYDHIVNKNGPAFKGRWRSYANYFRAYEGKDMGYFGGLLNMTKQLARKMIWMNTEFEKTDGLSDIDVANMRKNMQEIKFLIAITALTLLLTAGIADDDDDEETKAICLFWINRLSMMENDIMFMANPSFWNNMQQNTAPVFNMLANVGKVMYDVTDLLTGGENVYTTGSRSGEGKLPYDLGKITIGVATYQRIVDNFNNDRSNNTYTEMIVKNLGN